MKLFFVLTVLTFGFAVQAEPLKLSGSYQLQSWTCADNTAPFSKDIVARIVGSTFLKIEKNKMTTTLKFDQGCEISWVGQFRITEDTLDLSEMIPKASSACHDVSNEKEPAISFTLTSEANTLTLFHAASLSEPCGTGSIRVYKRWLKKNN